MHQSDSQKPDFLSGSFETQKIAYEVARSLSKVDVWASSRWQKRQESFLNDSLAGKSPRHTSLPEVIKKSKAKVVFEFGGGSGWVWNLISNDVKANLRYINLELPETCNKYQNFVGLSSAISFVSEIHDLDIKAEHQILFYTNSVMQYVEDGKIEETFNVLHSCTEALFDELVFTDFQSYWTLQEYYGSKIPYFVRNRRDFIENMARFGFFAKAQDISSPSQEISERAKKLWYTENLYFLKMH